jgi:hypothetical protein
MAVSMSADGGTKAYSDPQPMSVSMTSYAADARTNAADADTTDARTNASDTSDPANATDASDATYTTGNTASGATSSTSGGTSSTCGGTSSTCGGTGSTSGGTSSTCGGTSSSSYATGNTASYRQRDSADRERCNPETCADDSHTRSSMILSPVMNSEPERHSRRSLTLARVIGRGIRSENDLGKL